MANASPSLSNLEPNFYRNGILLALFCYTFWGFFPIYFKVMHHVPPVEMLAHRLVWSLPFGALIIAARGQWGQVKSAIIDLRTLGWLCVSACFIAINWGVYIWAVQLGEIMQASLGYYINPLVYVIVGVLFFKEALNRWQMFAVALAAIGVTYLAVMGGQIPWISLTLAASFTVYGVVRKQVNVGGMPGIFIETLVLFPLGAAYLTYLYVTGANLFSLSDWGTSFGLILSGPFTVVPFLAFALAARRLPLSTIGIIQFLGPSLQFAIAVYFGETLDSARLICFGFIWSAVTIFCFAAWRKSRAAKALG